jgi:LPS export ABC transporter protein LptC
MPGSSSVNMSKHSNLKNLFVVAALFFLASSCENDDRVLKDWTKNVVLKEEATQITTYLSQQGLLRAKIIAPVMNKFSTDTVALIFPKTLHCDFFNDSIQKESWLDARYGVYYENLNKVFLKDSVVVITSKGDTLISPELWWDQNTQLFYTDKYAIYKGPGKNIYGGKGLEATQDLKRITFKETSGTMQVVDGPTTPALSAPPPAVTK